MEDEATTRAYLQYVDEFNDGTNWALHYVTAREMYNIAIAAMRGKSGNPAAYRDLVFGPPPVVSKVNAEPRVNADGSLR